MVTSRVWFAAEQRVELWERSNQGQSISSISGALERRTKGGIQRIVVVHGGNCTVATAKSCLDARTGGLTERIGTLPEELRRSLTWYQGKEMARHKSFAIATDLQVDFCDPRSPWQRGSNENTNGLLRQYFPRATGPTRLYRSAAQTETPKNPGL